MAPVKAAQFTPGDPEIELLNQLLARDDVSPDNRTHLHFALGKACDAIGLYGEAFSNYRQGNEEIARQTPFDASDHRKQVTDIKRVFRDWPAGADPGDGDPVPIFVVGMSRSGKSLTESLLSQHEDVYGAGESRAWNTALRTVLHKNGISGPFPAYVESLTDGQIREMGEIYMKEVSRLSPGSRFYVDTMPGNYPYVGLIFRALPSARMIHCHRDPVDNCLFIYFQRYRLRLGKHGYSYDLRNIGISLLSQHEDVYGAGESRAWNTALRTVLHKNGISGPFPAYVESLTDGQIREMGEIYMKEVSRLSPGSRFYVDTMPGNYPYVGLIFRALPSARMIHCHRDPVDNCLFIYFQRYRLRLGKHGYSYDLRNIASYYAGYEDVMAHWRKLYGDRILSLPYEEMMRNPARTTARIFAFCGLGYDPGAIRAAFTTDQIGHWKHYESYLGPLRQALGRRARQADGPIEASRP